MVRRRARYLLLLRVHIGLDIAEQARGQGGGGAMMGGGIGAMNVGVMDPLAFSKKNSAPEKTKLPHLNSAAPRRQQSLR